MLADRVLAAQASLTRHSLRCRQSFTDFVLAAARNEEGEKIQLAPMHLAWHRHIDYCWSNGLHCMIQAHWSSGKSAGLVVPIAAWLVGNDVQRRIKIISNGDQQAARRVASAKRLMESQSYRLIFDNVKRGHKWTEHEIYVQRRGFSIDPTIESRGVFTIGVGARADVLIFDDVVDQKNSEDQAQRERVLRTIEQTWLSRLEPGGNGLVLYVTTPWHCLLPSTLVLTKRGRVRADALRYDDAIEVAADRFERIRKMQVQRFCGTALSIRAAWCGEPVIVTPEHKMPTRRGLVEAADITVHDWLEIVVPARLPELDPSSVAPCDPPLPSMSNRRAAARAGHYRSRKFDAMELRRLRDAGVSLREIAVRLGIAAGSVSYAAARLSLGRRRKGLGRLSVDAARPEFWRMIGLWLAEGTVADGDREIAFFFGKSDAERALARFVVTELGNCGLYARTTRRRGNWEVHCCNVTLGSWLARTFGAGASRKRLPDWWPRLPSPLIMAAFAGWAAGDGHVNSAGRTVVCTVSVDLAHDWQRSLLAHGHRVAVYRSKQTTAAIGARAFRFVEPYRYTVAVGSEKRSGKGLGRAILADGRAFVKILSIETLPYDGPVYDLQTSTGVFTGAALLLHNSADATHVLMRRPGWCTLVQRVSADFRQIEQEVLGATVPYP